MRTLIASNENALAEIIRTEMLGSGPDASCQIARFDAVVHEVSEFKPLLIVLVLEPEPALGEVMLVELRRIFEIPIMVFGAADDPKFILQVLREGASEYLDAADCLAELKGALDACKPCRRSKKPRARSSRLCPRAAAAAPAPWLPTSPRCWRRIARPACSWTSNSKPAFSRPCSTCIRPTA